jgi:methylated-DNA-[protein]-cysteine S-methyltransferase
MTRSRTRMPSPIGELTIVADDGAVGVIRFPGDSAIDDQDAIDVAADERPVLARAVAQLDEYFAGTRTSFDLPLAPAGTPFQQQAWSALADIPFGETRTYGEQAAMLGDRNKSRAVGAANGRNPIPIVVPCHRVVGSNGHLTGFAGGLETKAWLLDHELRVRAAG